jgi:hypothetical protein
MNFQSMQVEKVQVKCCEICNLDRIPKAAQHDYDNYKGEPGIHVSVSNDTDEDWNNNPKVRSLTVCQVCADNMIHLHNVMVANKLGSAAKVDVRYILAKEPEVEEFEKNE